MRRLPRSIRQPGFGVRAGRVGRALLDPVNRRPLAGRALVAAGLALAGCTPGHEWDRDVGRAYSPMVEAEMGLVDDPQLTAYVRAIGNRLVTHVPDRRFEYTFQVVDDESPNAFSLPGGYVYVSRGLLVLTDSEDELANVIAHEIGHVEARHSALRQSKVTLPDLLALPGGAVGAVMPRLGDAIASPFQEASARYIASYSRDQEHESDEIGQELCASSGFDPAAMTTLLESLEREEILRRGEPRTASFLDAHPPTPDRAERTAQRARSLQWSRTYGPPPDRAAFLGRLDGIVVGWNPALGVFQGRQFLHPELNWAARIPEGWTPSQARWAVGAVAPEHDAMLFVQTPQPGTDPRTAAEMLAAALAERLRVTATESEALQIGDLPAHRVSTRVGDGRDAVVLEFTVVGYRDQLYLATGVTLARRTDHIEAIRESIATFRPLTSRERRSIRIVRLRTATARAGESLSALSARTDNVWSVEETAVMNGIGADAPLPGGQVVKVAVAEPYASADERQHP